MTDKPAGKTLLYLATLGPVGFIPFAPGTFGTMTALILFAHLRPSPALLAGLILAVTAIGIIASSGAERALGKKDPSEVVIDEFAGYLISVFYLPIDILNVAGAFLLFRVFDILKPPPIGRLQRLPGGIGVMADDVAAGILTNMVLQLWRHLS